MIRTQLLSEVKEWLEGDGYNISLDDIINEYKMDSITFTDIELNEIEMMFIDEKFRQYEEQAELEKINKRLLKEWEAEKRCQETEWRLDRL